MAVAGLVDSVMLNADAERCDNDGNDDVWWVDDDWYDGVVKKSLMMIMMMLPRVFCYTDAVSIDWETILMVDRLHLNRKQNPREPAENRHAFHRSTDNVFRCYSHHCYRFVLD